MWGRLGHRRTRERSFTPPLPLVETSSFSLAFLHLLCLCFFCLLVLVLLPYMVMFESSERTRMRNCHMGAAGSEREATHAAACPGGTRRTRCHCIPRPVPIETLCKTCNASALPGAPQVGVTLLASSAPKVPSGLCTAYRARCPTLLPPELAPVSL